MLQSIDYSVEFPTTGRSFQNRIEFAPGLTAITGRNEAGKTLVFEMIGYCLFGKDALRGLARDYRHLSALLTLTVHNQSWTLDRQPRMERFLIDGEAIAVGAEAINREVPARLGFGLDVWNIAIAAQQGDLGALTEMRPTARRDMIDRLIGLDLLESIEKQCKAEAKTNETVALSLATSMATPEEPIQPDDFLPSVALEGEIQAVNESERTRLELLRVKEPEMPQVPPAVEGDVDELEQHEAVRNDALRLQAQLTGHLSAIPEPSCTRAELEAAIAFKAYQDEVTRRGPRPDYGVDQLREWEGVWQQKALLNSGTIVCPQCDHEFVQDKDVDVNHIHLLAQPPINEREITSQMRRHQLWDESLEDVPPATVSDIQQEILAHARADERNNIADQLRGLEIPADRSGTLRAARAYREALAVYREREDRYLSELDYYRDSQSRLAGYPDQSVLLADLSRRLGESRAYEAAYGRYLDQSARYEELAGRVRGARDTAEGFGRGAVALKNARVRVKQELAPSLSKAASALITAMTDGERRYVDVDHDFNIMVDGQPLQTLSGSGKSVVNLALRIGLGQVLTSKVLPIFMGDEIDKDMDEQRETATHGTLRRLLEHLSQIVIVTHKKIDADHTIVM